MNRPLLAAASGAFFAFAAACTATTEGSGASSGGSSSSSSTSSGGSSGAPSSSGSTGSSSGTTSSSGDAGGGSGFDLAIDNGGGANIAQTAFRAPVHGSFCQGQPPNKTCSFTGSITSGSCTSIVNVAVVGTPEQDASFPLVTDPTTPPGKGTVNYTEICGGSTKTFKATGGTVTLTKVTPAAAGYPTGTLSLTVSSATMAPAPNGAGDAQGSFEIEGTGSDLTATGL